MQSNSNGQRRECVEFNGVKYYRYPDSPKKWRRNYYQADSSDAIKTSQRILHREIYKFYRGEIQKGYDVHHKDQNPLNNHPDNLEALSKKEHARRHITPEMTRWRRENADRIRYLAVSWHSTPEGVEWHRQHGAETWEGRESIPATCIQCEQVFECYFPERAKLCSRKCINAHSQITKRYYQDRSCAVCLNSFLARPHDTQQTCSRKCAWVLRKQRSL